MIESTLIPLKRVIHSDITRVYHLPMARRREPTNKQGSWGFGFLDATALSPWRNQEELGITPEHINLAASGEARCFGATSASQLAAYAWFAQGRVSERHNTGGRRFSGIGLTLPPGVAYVFKCLVAPAFRGHALMSSLLFAASKALEKEGVDQLITTTDISNRAFQNSVERVGFEHVDHAAEFVLFGRHYFRLPKPRTCASFFGGAPS